MIAGSTYVLVSNRYARNRVDRCMCLDISKFIVDTDRRAAAGSLSMIREGIDARIRSAASSVRSTHAKWNLAVSSRGHLVQE